MGCLALFPEQCAKGRIDCFNWLDSPKGNSLLKGVFFSLHVFSLAPIGALDDKRKTLMHQIDATAENKISDQLLPFYRP